ncbi:2-oxo-4-hydroxy-4-carboxy-5-ureidoimidazoline decarboxylase [Spirulina sp. 06S082]|uniref:2-oxo-4-hydroxy-4-carboxy-5-ureidoimidazoline decarboxylase n=1 Tax=Spirulina sp. 06S082 TaxID=3110248 RepID=UPI002B1FC4E8|nr:2-oxo-4-hydroxy-4-carboxy-5-ureidoimidazoline decarboxylase [Spirulina sp. 06S082]MEA5468221.1 2-oxo-4-hydroxy-4-carboxy-5-ureidoimidazoline decarboxylase [Spirulina sp. 06S082]
MSYTIAELNQMSQETFTNVLADIFEQTPSIAAKTWESLPFQDTNSLHEKMVFVMNELSAEKQLELMRSHPDLGSKAKMAEASVQEQKGVGLNCLSPEEFQRFNNLNQAYREKFGFPFLIAVKNHTKTSILEAFESRLKNDAQTEQKQALREISQIAFFRLQDIIKE